MYELAEARLPLMSYPQFSEDCQKCDEIERSIRSLVVVLTRLPTDRIAEKSSSPQAKLLIPTISHPLVLSNQPSRRESPWIILVRIYLYRVVAPAVYQKICLIFVSMYRNPGNFVSFKEIGRYLHILCLDRLPHKAMKGILELDKVHGWEVQY